MDVHDIVYLDVPRFESLTSQRMRGLTHSRTVIEHVVKEKTSALEGPSKATNEGSGHHTGHTREIRDLDNSFCEFLEAIKDDTVNITSDLDRSRTACEAALLSGQFVRAQGPFYYNDFKWLKTFSGLWKKGTEALYKMSPPTREARADFDATKQNVENIWPVVDFVFGDAIECGVALGRPEEGLLVKAVLGREHLRTDTGSLIERYGTKTRCNFTILGTVARLGWHIDVELIDRLIAATTEGSQEFVKQVQTVQETAVNIRRNMRGADDHSVHLMPIALYRTSTLKDPEAAPTKGE